MKIWLAIALFFVSSFAFAQTSVKEKVTKLDKALIAKDTVALKQLLHKDASYGHSNGWVETKEDVIKDLLSGKLTYTKIESKDVQWTANKDWASMRNTTEIKYLLDGKEGELKLHVLQVWIRTSKGWQLIARQSTKL